MGKVIHFPNKGDPIETDVPDDEKTGILTHDQINLIHSLTQQLTETDDPDEVDRLVFRIKGEVLAWPFPSGTA